jgi:hypothetical protein
MTAIVGLLLIAAGVTWFFAAALGPVKLLAGPCRGSDRLRRGGDRRRRGVGGASPGGFVMGKCLQ